MLSPATVQVLLAELQHGIIDLSATNQPSAIRRSAGVLAQITRALDIPITLTAAPATGEPTIIEELRGAPLPFVRGGPACWDDPALRQALLDNDRPTLVLGGVTTEIVVLHTALDALAAGLSVQVLVDVSGGISDRTERAALHQIEAAGGRVTSVASFATDMVRDFTTPGGQEIITALHGLMS